MRLPPSQVTEESINASDSNATREFNTDELREAFLVRRARDSPAHAAKTSGSRFSSGMWAMGMGGSGQKQRMGGATAGWGPKGLAEGIGIDARRYVDELLSLNR
jgi:ribosomal protein L4